MDKFWSEKLTWAFGSGKHKINWLKSQWNVPAIQSTELSLNGHWNATENNFLVIIQSPFSHHSVDWRWDFILCLASVRARGDYPGRSFRWGSKAKIAKHLLKFCSLSLAIEMSLMMIYSWMGWKHEYLFPKIFYKGKKCKRRWVSVI